MSIAEELRSKLVELEAHCTLQYIADTAGCSLRAVQAVKAGSVLDPRTSISDAIRALHERFVVVGEPDRFTGNYEASFISGAESREKA